jgi:hypothetical protein
LARTDRKTRSREISPLSPSPEPASIEPEGTSRQAAAVLLGSTPEGASPSRTTKLNSRGLAPPLGHPLPADPKALRSKARTSWQDQPFRSLPVSTPAPVSRNPPPGSNLWLPEGRRPFDRRWLRAKPSATPRCRPTPNRSLPVRTPVLVSRNPLQLPSFRLPEGRRPSDFRSLEQSPAWRRSTT